MVNTVYVVGAHGQVGRALAATAPDTVSLRGLGSADIDITNADSVQAALGDLAAGDVVINTAAYTAVDAAESDRDGAYAVNAIGAGNLAAATAAAGARLIHLSTDYVYGTGVAHRPLEPVDLDLRDPPATVYGASKLAGEQAVLAADPNAVVVRTAWVYTGTPGASDFVATMRRLESDRPEITVVDDQTGSPTYALDLATGLWELVANGAGESHILHATNTGQATWFELARAVFTDLGADSERVTPCTSAEFVRPAPRPAYSVLSPKSWIDAGLTPLPAWDDAVTRALTGTG